MYLSGLDPEVLRVLTQRKVVDYLRRRRAASLARGDYSIEVVEGRNAELAAPEQPDGVRLAIPAQSTLWGRIEFALYVAAGDDKHRRVAVVAGPGPRSSTTWRSWRSSPDRLGPVTRCPARSSSRAWPRRPAPGPDPGEARSRFEPETGVVLYNREHPDYLLAKDDDAALLDYLSTLVAKKYVVYNNPRAASAELGEEMVRMLVRVRRYLPRRAKRGSPGRARLSCTGPWPPPGPGAG